ncbi:hypothetical protein [Chitinophaga sp.]|uniref:hypothetical protein n=1 Tax=Chitinophaga sp. TaxID=1869181 RepID=UPI0031D2B5FB
MSDERDEIMLKFLIAIIYQGQTYYTVHGTDFSINDVNANNDKVLLTEYGKWRLFRTKTDLATYIGEAKHLWDADRLKEWAASVNEYSEVQAEFDLDFLLIAKDDVDDYYEVYRTIIFIEDFVDQVGDEALWKLTRGSSAVREFFEAASDYFLWRDGDKEMLAIRGPRLLLALDNIYRELQKWIEV